MGRNTQQQQHEDPLSRLHKAHSTISQVLTQIDGLVLEAHRLGAQKQISGLDLCSFSKLMETMASSLQEWIPRFEGATHGVCMEDPVCQDDGNSTSMQGNDDESSDGESLLSMQSKNLSTSLLDVDVLLEGQNNVLSNSPLVPWLDTMQFFLLTPMAKPKKAVSHVLLSRSSFKEQGSSQTPLQAREGIIPVNLSPSLDTCAEIMPVVPGPVTTSDLCMNEQESITETCLIAASTPARLLQQHSIEDPESIDIVTPVPPQSLVKRYSNFYEADEHFSDASPMPLITPDVKQKQASLQGLTAKAEESMEITEYFTAFSPPRSLAPSIFKSKRSPCSLVSVNSSPQVKAGGTIRRHEGFSNAFEHSTPLPPQSLIKRYPQLLHTEEERDEMIDSNVTLTQMLMSSPPNICKLTRSNHTEEERDEMADSTVTGTQMLMSFPPKTCILMRTIHAENSVRSRKSLQTPRLPPKSPFRTPGLESTKVIIDPFYEDMDLTSLKKPGQPSRHPESARKTPSSDMQFATIKKALGFVKRTPLVDLQLSTVRKPGAPLPGEQTLKRELWSRMEAEFESMAHVCKSLFTENQTESLADPKVEKAGVENRHSLKGKLAAPRAIW